MDGCCAECTNTPGCNVFSVWLGNPPALPAQCYLKKSAAGKRTSANHTSGAVANPAPDPAQLLNATDCAMRSLFVEYAAHVNPNVDEAMAREIIDALAGDPKMGRGCVIEPPQLSPQPGAPTAPLPRGGVQFFADAVEGDDSAAGSEQTPFKTVHRAVQAVRAASPGRQGGTVTLRAGVFHLMAPLLLTEADSGLTIETHEADGSSLAWLSGAAPLGAGVNWKAVNTTGGANVWAADLSATTITSVPSLRWQGRRLWRARFPNGATWCCRM